MEIIRGIIRKTINKSHIQVNINKLLEYLRSLEKFNPRNLWANNEICCGDSKTIFELLDDIWHFYSNKNFENKSKKNSILKENKFLPSDINYNSNSHFMSNPIQREHSVNFKSINSNNHLMNERKNKNRDNSLNSISILNNSNKNNFNKVNKIKDMNAFSPINKHGDRESKFYQHTNIDLFNVLIGEDDKVSNKASNKNLINGTY